jgi:hypothetical protein
MHPFDLELLLKPGLLIFTATLWVAFLVTRSSVFSLSAALIKAGIFLVYFGVLFDGTFTFLDDWVYVNGGVEVVAEGIGLSNLDENWDFVLMTGGGKHFIYYLYNAYAFRFFGVGYYAPVALNIVLTILISWFGAIVGAREFGFTGQWKKLFFMFLLFHPDILAWSNVMNGKDTLVLLLHVLLLLSASMFFRGRKLAALAIAAPVVILLFFLRFYVPAIFATVLVVHQLLAVRRRHDLYWLLGGASILFVAIYSTVAQLSNFALLGFQENLVNPVFGFVRMALTPIPFNTEVTYGFLDIPALLHWMLMPMVVYGVVLLMRREKHPFTRFFLIYLVAFMGFYSIYGELQGPRHRVQLDFALAALQFIGIKQYLIRLFASRRELQSHSFVMRD